MLQDCYHILNLNPGATLDEIRKAYRLKAKLIHPDASGSPDAASEFIRLKEAFDLVLKNKYLEDSGRLRDFAHPRDPYFQHRQGPHVQHPQTNRTPETGERIDPNDFLHSKAGYILYLFMHVLFLGTGFIVLLSPLFTLITRGFDSYGSLAYSVFNLVIAMAFGLTMIVKITGSFFQFIKKPY